MSAHNRFFDQKPRIEWGSETGVEGKQKSRLVSLQEIHNFRRITHLGYTFYLTILDTKHPKFIRITDTGYERWRMRFNVFTTGFFAEWLPNTLLHLGELHVYYDLISDRKTPICDDFTFYYDKRPIGAEVLEQRYQQMDFAFRESLVGRDQVMRYKLFLPIRKEELSSTNKDLDDFLERQEVMSQQLQQLKAEPGRGVSFGAAVKGGITHTKLLYNIHDLEKRRAPYQRNAYQRVIKS